jgi:CSLREA domain-containing protein
VIVLGNSRAWPRVSFRVLLVLLVAAVPARCVLAATFNVNSQVDVVDANPGDGICRTAPNNTVCTLRAAIMEANALPGADTINLQANKTYTLELAGDEDGGLNGDLDVLDSVTIVGAGAASSIIDGNGLVTGDRIMTVYKCIRSTETGTCPSGILVATISGVGFRHGRKEFGDGGALANFGMLTMHDCAFTENFAENGGGIHNNYIATLDISNSTVAGNYVSGAGAGVESAGPMTMVDTTVRDNVIQGSQLPNGGGIFVIFSTATINRSTISNNSATFGGGIYAQSGTLHLINSTISGNYSYVSGGGIAVNGGIVGLYNVTIAGNVANSDASGTGDFGGGVYNNGGGGSLTFRNSILTGNLHLNQMGAPSNDECFGLFASAGNNIVTVPIGGVCQITGSYATVDASLGPLQNNGGPTQTHALTSGSLAIDAGNNLDGCTDNVGDILTTDQRGVQRPFGPACDIGAVEAGDGIFRSGFES